MKLTNKFILNLLSRFYSKHYHPNLSLFCFRSILFLLYMELKSNLFSFLNSGSVIRTLVLHKNKILVLLMYNTHTHTHVLGLEN
jgi:hypothetical protein